MLKKHEDGGTTDSKEYNQAYGVLFKKHICKVSPLPNYLIKCVEEARKDTTVALTMYVRLSHWDRSLLMKAQERTECLVQEFGHLEELEHDWARS